MADLVNEAISWLQNGEPVTGGSGGNSDGVLNRPLVQLLANDNGLQDRVDIIADDDGFIKKPISSVKIVDTDAATTARVQIDATGLKAWDGTNTILSVDESGGISLGYGSNDVITLAAGVITLKANELDITGTSNSGATFNNATANAITISGAGTNAMRVVDTTAGHGITVEHAALNGFICDDAGKYGMSLGKCTTGGYGPLRMLNAEVAGASNLNSTYTNAEADTLAIDSNHDLFVATATATFRKIGATTLADSSVIADTATTDNAVILDASGLTMRKGSGAVRFDVNEDGSFTLGYSSGANLAFTTGDAMTLTNATLTGCSISGGQINSGTVGATYIADLSSTYAVVALGVTNGDSHDHNGGDGAQIDHVNLSSIGSNAHSAIDTHIGNSASVHGVTGSVVGTSDAQSLTNKSFDTLAGSGKHIILDRTDHTMKLYGFRYTGSVTSEILYTLSDKTLGSYILNIGNTTTSGGPACIGGIYAAAYNAVGITGESDNTHGVIGISNSGNGVLGASTTGTCVNAASQGANCNYLFYGSGDVDMAMLRLSPNSSSNAPSHTSANGSFWLNSELNLYVNTDSATTWKKFIKEDSYCRFNHFVGFEGHDSTPAGLTFVGTNVAGTPTRISSNAAGTAVTTVPDTTNLVDYNIGSLTYGFKRMNLKCVDQLVLESWTDVNNYSIIIVDSDSGTAPNTEFRSVSGGTSRSVFLGSGGDLYPGVADTQTCGASGNEWLSVYMFNSPVVGDFYFMDTRKEGEEEIEVDDIATLKAIKSSGKHDSITGLMLIDDDTIPEWLKFKNRSSGMTEYNKDGKPYLDLKTLISLCMGAIRQLSGQIEELQSEIAVLKNK